VEITNDFKLEFLSSILNDTTELRIISSKSELISNYHELGLPNLPTKRGNSRETISHTKFISDTLNVRDTMFIRQQIIDNTKLDIDKLSEYGFKIFDQKILVDQNLSRKQIWDIADKLNAGTNNKSFLKISKPIFNKKQNLAYLMLEKGYFGETLILEKRDNKWRVKYMINEWEE